MPYKIISSEPSEIVLERTSVWFVAILFAAVGSIFFFIGIGMNFFMDNDFSSLLFRILFPGMGLLFAFVGFSLPASTRKTTPQRIRFDNRKGIVTIEMTNSGEQSSYIRYDEIEKFDIYTEARSSSGSSGKGMNRTTYYYHVLLRKKDGSEWFLTESGNYNESEKMLEKFRNEVQLQNPAVLRSTLVFPDKMNKDETSGKTVLRWRNKISLVAPAILILFAVVFITIVSTIFSTSSPTEFSIFAFVIGSFILLVFGIVAFVIVRQLIKDAFTIYSLVIDRTQLEYQELTKSEVIRNSRVIPMKDIYSIYYSFSPVKNYGLAGLHILTHKEFERLSFYKEKPLEEFKDLFRKETGPVKLNITAFNPVEFLQLENWLQDVIRKKANVEVL